MFPSARTITNFYSVLQTLYCVEVKHDQKIDQWNGFSVVPNLISASGIEIQKKQVNLEPNTRDVRVENGPSSYKSSKKLGTVKIRIH